MRFFISTLPILFAMLQLSSGHQSNCGAPAPAPSAPSDVSSSAPAPSVTAAGTPDIMPSPVATPSASCAASRSGRINIDSQEDTALFLSKKHVTISAEGSMSNGGGGASDDKDQAQAASYHGHRYYDDDDHYHGYYHRRNWWRHHGGRRDRYY